MPPDAHLPDWRRPADTQKVLMPKEAISSSEQNGHLTDWRRLGKMPKGVFDQNYKFFDHGEYRPGDTAATGGRVDTQKSSRYYT